MSDALKQLLEELIPAPLLTPELLRRVQDAAAHSNVDVRVDLQRQMRCGFPEVIFGEGKSAAMIARILRQQQEAGQFGLVTRVADGTARHILSEFPAAIHNPVARTVRLVPPSDPAARPSGPVYVVTAGSCDRPVAEEAVETLRWMNVGCELIQDVGVAGPHRLLHHVDRLRTADAIVCVAGMEAALPSVLGGHVPCAVIGVPTSVGYGATFQGVTALLSMMTCCASNVTTVNIDAGFKGGFVAGIIAQRIADARREKG